MWYHLEVACRKRQLAISKGDKVGDLREKIQAYLDAHDGDPEEYDEAHSPGPKRRHPLDRVPILVAHPFWLSVQPDFVALTGMCRG